MVQVSFQHFNYLFSKVQNMTILQSITHFVVLLVNSFCFLLPLRAVVNGWVNSLGNWFPLTSPYSLNLRANPQHPDACFLSLVLHLFRSSVVPCTQKFRFLASLENNQKTQYSESVILCGTSSWNCITAVLFRWSSHSLVS